MPAEVALWPESNKAMEGADFKAKGAANGPGGGPGSTLIQIIGSYIPMVKPQDLKFGPHVQSKTQTVTYAFVKDAIVQYILKIFKDGNDIDQLIKDGT